jgi:thiamine-phosphate pyrophosphorylase
MKLHAIVGDLDTALRAVDGGATVVQLRLKGVPTEDVIEAGRAIRTLCAERGVTFVVNDDVDAAIALGADGVHLGRDDAGSEQALAAGLVLGRSAATEDEARTAEDEGASYLGAGPVWATPTKTDADPPIGLAGLRVICAAVSIPVVAIGGIDVTNAHDCIEAGAAGVAVVRAAAQAAELSAAL